MKYIKRSKDVDLVFFDDVDNDKNYYELYCPNHYQHTTLNELKQHNMFGSQINKLQFCTRANLFYQYRGILGEYSYDEFLKPLVILFREDNRLKAWVNESYLVFYPSRKTLLNKFAKNNNIKQKDIIYIRQKEIEDKIEAKIIIEMKDYFEDFQHQLSNEFLNKLKLEYEQV